MAVPEVNKKFLDELEEMGFPTPLATRALHNCGNSSLEDAVKWIFDHETEPDIDQMPLEPVEINIEASKSSDISEKVKFKAQELRDRARRRKEVLEKKSEREREKERMKAGKELLEAKRIAEENERKRFLDLRKAEKEEEKRARERIRQKLQQDKLERRHGLGLPAQDPAFVKPATPITHEEKEPLPVKPATLPVKFIAKTELLGECLRSLRRNHKDDDAKVKKAFQTLLVYIRNVAWDPDEEKFRKIRLSNPAFRERVGRFEKGVEFLEFCGFEKIEEGKFLYLPRDKVDEAVIRSAVTQLHSAITNPFFGLLSS